MSSSLALATLLLSVVAMCVGKTFTIVPGNSTVMCNIKLCYTLDQLAGKSINPTTQLTLYFYPGEHFLNRQLAFSRIENIKMIGSSPKVEIWLRRSELIMSEIQNLDIENLAFVNGSEWIQFYQCSNIKLKRCIFREAMVGIEADRLTMTSCIFSHVHTLKRVRFIEVSSNYANITSCEFTDNESDGASIIGKELLHVSNSIFSNNVISQFGITVAAFDSGTIYISNCDFIANSVKYEDGRAISIGSAARVVIHGTNFRNNNGADGEAISIALVGNLEIVKCTFADNHVYNKTRGVILTRSIDLFQSKVAFVNTLFTNNFGTSTLTILEFIVSMKNTTFTGNSNSKVLTTVQSTLKLQQVLINQNRGYIYFFNSKVVMIGPITIRDNTGGAIRAIQSQIQINRTSMGRIVINNNTARSGGGILLQESDLIVQYPITISNNRADLFGGGIYMYQSVIDFTSKQRIGESFITSNVAGQSGGGVYAVASTIKLSHSFLTIGFNSAWLSGGGLYLQASSKLYLFKQLPDYNKLNVRLDIMSNKAVYGGGIFVLDNSTAGSQQCHANKENYIDEEVSTSPNCFIQTIQLYRYYKGQFGNQYIHS